MSSWARGILSENFCNNKNKVRIEWIICSLIRFRTKSEIFQSSNWANFVINISTFSLLSREREKQNSDRITRFLKIRILLSNKIFFYAIETKFAFSKVKLLLFFCFVRIFKSVFDISWTNRKKGPNKN